MVAASTRLEAPSLRKMCETWTPAVLDADHQCRRDLPVGAAPGHEIKHLHFARRQPENDAETLAFPRGSHVRNREVEPSPSRQQLELLQ